MGDNARDMMQKQSSFARSFFAGEAENANSKSAAEKSAVPMPKSRRMSSHRRSFRPPSRNMHTSTTSAGASAGRTIDEDEPTDLPHLSVSEDEPNSQRANSWYVDALRQEGGTAETLTELLGDGQPSGTSASPNNNGGWDDNEVLEQYRLMAQHEANLRVKENTGFDRFEYEKRRKLQQPESKDSLYGGGKKTKQQLPEQRKITSPSMSITPKATEPPPLQNVSSNRRFIEQKMSRVPELCQGNLAEGVTNTPINEHTVRCLGCPEQLRVKRLATLMSCPNCNTVSPASSTRR